MRLITAEQHPAHALRRAHLAFVSLSDNLDLNTASGRLMFNIIGAMGEFERELIRERVKAGMRNAKAKGNEDGSAIKGH